MEIFSSVLRDVQMSWITRNVVRVYILIHSTVKVRLMRASKEMKNHYTDKSTNLVVCIYCN
jgi:hypothetical protein